MGFLYYITNPITAIGVANTTGRILLLTNQCKLINWKKKKILELDLNPQPPQLWKTGFTVALIFLSLYAINFVIKRIPSIFPSLELRYIRTFQCNYWPRKKQTGKKANILPNSLFATFFFGGGEFSSDYIANSLRLLLLLMTISHVVFSSFLVQPQKSYIL